MDFTVQVRKTGINDFHCQRTRSSNSNQVVSGNLVKIG